MKPELNTVPEFYRGYVECTNQTPLMEQFNQSTHQLSLIMDGLNEETADYSYLEGKMVIKRTILTYHRCRTCFFISRPVYL